jgi:hypothetical protein
MSTTHVATRHRYYLRLSSRPLHAEVTSTVSPSHALESELHIPSKQHPPSENVGHHTNPANPLFVTPEKSALKPSLSTFPSRTQELTKRVHFKEPTANELIREAMSNGRASKKSKKADALLLPSASAWTPTTIEEFHVEYSLNPSDLYSVVPTHFWTDKVPDTTGTLFHLAYTESRL